MDKTTDGCSQVTVVTFSEFQQYAISHDLVTAVRLQRFADAVDRLPQWAIPSRVDSWLDCLAAWQWAENGASAEQVRRRLDAFQG